MAAPEEEQEEGQFFATVPPDAPLFLDFKHGGYNSVEGDAAGYREPASRAKHFMQYRGLSLDIAKVIINISLPPLVFTYVSSLLCFSPHFWFPRFVWLYVLPGLLPAWFGMMLYRAAKRRGVSSRWNALAVALCCVAFLSAAIFGERTFWYLFHPFYVLESMKTYSNIDPSEVSGVRLMDAAQVHFSTGSRLATDMGMSFTTSWDVYCVAPITTASGLPSQGATLETYDMWAVGVNCCRSAESNFRCGQYDNVEARAGLRQVGDEQRRFFRLAVQQAEAAYGIQAPNPVFFHWVEDPQVEESMFFEMGFEYWVLANSLHFAANCVAVIAFVLLFHKPPGDDGLPKV